MSDDTIKRSDAIKAILQKPAIHGSEGSWYHADDIRDALNAVPSADRPSAVYEYLKRKIGDTVDSETEFDAWFNRMVWHVEECNRLADRLQEDYNRGYCDAVQGIADEMVKQGKCIVQDKPQGWIPCSERLPERDGDYLATLHHKWPDREYKTVEVKKFRSDGFDENLYVKVVAWRPLPEPWEGAEDEA